MTLISRREWRAVIIYALVILLLTTLPYLLGWAKQDVDWTFSGFLIGAEDGNSYLGKMGLGARGLWDFHLFYTAEEHQGAGLIFLPYILPGQLVRLFMGDDNPALTGTLLFVFHAMRLVFDVLLIIVMYRFIAVFLRTPATRMLALVLATLGGGIGWLLTLIGQGDLLGTLPPDFFIPEGFSFIILFSLPHLALARAALLGGFLFLFPSNHREESQVIATPFSPRPEGEGLGVRIVLAALCWLVVGLAVPFYLVIIYVLVSVWILAVWLRTRAFPTSLFLRCAIAVGITLPLFAYYTSVFTSNPVFAWWSAQNLLPSPHPLHYLLAYGLMGALAFVGGRWAWKRGDIPHLLLVGWVVIVPFLVYLPINVQRRMAEAVLVPLAILAIAGLRLLARSYWRRARNLVLVAALLTSLFLLLGSILTTLKHDRPLYYPAAEVAAFQWLNANAEPEAVVLSSKAVGNLIPVWTPLRTYVGHGPETLDAVHKEALVERFFRDQLTANERQSLYDTMRIRYIFYGSAERALSGGIDAPDWQDGLTRLYEHDGYLIYEVPPDQSLGNS
jgi:hypothetical protein